VQCVSAQDCCSAERPAEGQGTNAASAAAAAIMTVCTADIQDLSSVARQLATL
jgi:hypothetical protein